MAMFWSLVLLLIYRYTCPPAMAFNSVFISSDTPLPMEITIITEAIPMIIPNIVKMDLPRLLLIFIRAIFMYSHNCDILVPPSTAAVQRNHML